MWGPNLLAGLKSVCTYSDKGRDMVKVARMCFMFSAELVKSSPKS